jgi:hypothetical protein
MKKDFTREQWLNAAAELLGDKVFQPVGFDIPSDVKVSCGWPSSGGVGSRQATIGQCFNRASSSNGVNEIFISPKLSDATKVLDVLAHELIHAIDDCKNGHKGAFRTMAKAIGLEGKMTATIASPELLERLNAISEFLGEYPHGELSANGKKQGTRMKKISCNSCDFAFRASQKQIDSIDFEKGCLSIGCDGELGVEA